LYFKYLKSVTLTIFSYRNTFAAVYVLINLFSIIFLAKPTADI